MAASDGSRIGRCGGKRIGFGGRGSLQMVGRRRWWWFLMGLWMVGGVEGEPMELGA